MIVESLQKNSSEIGIFDKRFVVFFEPIILSECKEIVFERDSDKDCIIFVWISVQEHLAWIKQLSWMFGVNILNFFRGHVLSLLQFENIFLSVDDFEGVDVREYLNDITGLQPSVGSDSLRSEVWLFVVSQKYMRASDP